MQESVNSLLLHAIMSLRSLCKYRLLFCAKPSVFVCVCVYLVKVKLGKKMSKSSVHHLFPVQPPFVQYKSFLVDLLWKSTVSYTLKTLYFPAVSTVQR